MMIFTNCTLSYIPPGFVIKDYHDGEEIEVFVYMDGDGNDSKYNAYSYTPHFDSWQWPPWYKDQIIADNDINPEAGFQPTKSVDITRKSDLPFPDRQLLDVAKKEYSAAMRRWWPEYEDPVSHGFMKRIK